MNLEKRIKRHIIGHRHDFFAITLPGYERLCADALKSLSETLHVGGLVNGGVLFSGRLTDLYLANLHVRTAQRILMRLARFKATNFIQLESRTRKIPWDLYLPPGALPELKVTAHHCRLYHTRAVAERIQHSIAAQWSDYGALPYPSDEHALFIRLQDDIVTFSLDSSGRPLYQRGLKTHTARAPLRETMAAAILILAGYRPDRPLVDPMCGSGTFSLEAALMAKNIPPGGFRDFAFMKWPAFRPQQWVYLKKIADQEIHHPKTPLIWASDSDEKVCTRLMDCVRQNNLADAVTVAHKDFFNLKPETITKRSGLIVLNPPYGLRLLPKGDVQKLYNEIAAKLKLDFKGWKAALLIPKAGSVRRLGISLKPLGMHHGGLKVNLLVGQISR